MKTYKIKISVPCPNNRWKAEIKERNIDAESPIDSITKAVTEREYKKGVRIIEIWEQQDDRYHTFKLIM